MFFAANMENRNIFDRDSQMQTAAPPGVDLHWCHLFAWIRNATRQIREFDLRVKSKAAVVSTARASHRFT